MIKKMMTSLKMDLLASDLKVCGLKNWNQTHHMIFSVLMTDWFGKEWWVTRVAILSLHWQQLPWMTNVLICTFIAEHVHYLGSFIENRVTNDLIWSPMSIDSIMNANSCDRLKWLHTSSVWHVYWNLGQLRKICLRLVFLKACSRST